MSDRVVATPEVMTVVMTIVLTVLALPCVVVAARVGRRRWIRPCRVARVKAGLFRHQLTPS